MNLSAVGNIGSVVLRIASTATGESISSSCDVSQSRSSRFMKSDTLIPGSVITTLVQCTRGPMFGTHGSFQKSMDVPSPTYHLAPCKRKDRSDRIVLHTGDLLWDGRHSKKDVWLRYLVRMHLAQYESSDVRTLSMLVSSVGLSCSRVFVGTQVRPGALVV